MDSAIENQIEIESNDELLDIENEGSFLFG